MTIEEIYKNALKAICYTYDGKVGTIQESAEGKTLEFEATIGALTHHEKVSLSGGFENDALYQIGLTQLLSLLARLNNRLSELRRSDPTNAYRLIHLSGGAALNDLVEDAKNQQINQIKRLKGRLIELLVESGLSEEHKLKVTQKYHYSIEALEAMRLEYLEELKTDIAGAVKMLEVLNAEGEE